MAAKADRRVRSSHDACSCHSAKQGAEVRRHKTHVAVAIYKREPKRPRSTSMANPNDESAVNAMVKVLFNLAPGSLHGSATETMWATPIGKDEFMLKNTPFYAYGVSFGDAVFAPREDGLPVFKEVIRTGGHSTYRLLLDNARGAREFENFWRPLQECGCTYEEGIKPLLAVDVPPQADIFEVYRLLENGEKAGAWSFEEGHCGHPIKKEGSG